MSLCVSVGGNMANLVEVVVACLNIVCRMAHRSGDLTALADARALVDEVDWKGVDDGKSVSDRDGEDVATGGRVGHRADAGGSGDVGGAAEAAAPDSAVADG